MSKDDNIRAKRRGDPERSRRVVARKILGRGPRYEAGFRFAQQAPPTFSRGIPTERLSEQRLHLQLGDGFGRVYLLGADFLAIENGMASEDSEVRSYKCQPFLA